MIKRPTPLEMFMIKMAGPLVPLSNFVGRVLLGLIAIPLAIVFYIALYGYRLLLLLHWYGDTSVIAVRNFLNVRNYDE